ncbi:conjugal transfer protein MobB [Flavobacterium sp. FlaQc-48]|uniref:conjugal transfer protein MobB n=1 Tax=Flavobacterium sp. FlaQc-48 TaxID=3374181 RepID=UPI003756D238
MIAKIARGSNLYGALAYNQLKVEKEMGQILFQSRMIETPSGQYSAAQLAQSFEPHLIANRNTEKHTLHISINPDPKDKVSDEHYREMAVDYMQEMGYGQQPFVVFKHTDLDRTHIHIVSVCVDEDGKKISDKFEKRRSMNICREMEKKYGLIPATDKDRQVNDKIFQAVDYQKGDVKSQIASVVRYLPKHYKFETLGEYNALLSLFNITTEKVEGVLQGKMRQGLLYFPLKNNADKAGHGLKASLFGKSAGLSFLDLHFAKCREDLKDNEVKSALKDVIRNEAQSTRNEEDFKRQLAKHGINVMVRSNESGRVYGITFIDHNSRTVWNGSRLGKEFAANAFNDYWENKCKTNINEPFAIEPKIFHSRNFQEEPEGNPHVLFDFLKVDMKQGQTIEWCSLIPLAQGEDFEEQNFANMIRKKRKKGSGR